MVSASIGMAVAVPGITPQQPLHNDDLAMYETKSAAKGRVHVHTQGAPVQ